MLGYETSGYIWWNGEILPWEQGRPHFLSKGLQYAITVFEGVRAYWGPAGPAIFRLSDHTARLMRSAHLLGMEVDFSQGDLMDAQLQVASINEFQDCYFRPTIFLDAGGPGLASPAAPQIGIAAWKWTPKDFAKRAIRANVSTCRRVFPHEQLSQAKASINYLTGRLALKEAQSQGYDDAILLDDRNMVSEATTSNLFLAFGDKIVSPTLESALEGITRDSVIQILNETGISVDVRDVTVEEMLKADEIFLTGTASEITPLSHIEDVKLPGTDGPYAQFVQAAYTRAVNGTAYQDFDWRTPYLPVVSPRQPFPQSSVS